MKKMLRALTLPGLGVERWVVFPGIVIALLYFSWQASPYFMVYLVGDPDPGTAPRFTGSLRVEGEAQRGKYGLSPPRYFIQTQSGDVEYHCGFKPYPRECITPYESEMGKENIYTLGRHWFYGVDFQKSPDRFAKADADLNDPETIRSKRRAFLNKHRGSLLALVCTLIIYYCLIGHSREVTSRSI